MYKYLFIVLETMEKVVGLADKWARKEIAEYSEPNVLNYETSNQKGEELARKYDVDVNIVKIGTRLMDIKLGEALAKGKAQEHVAMSIEASTAFLDKQDISEEDKNKILNCVAGHHGTASWTCKEAEICANADCYRFLCVKNWLFMLHSLGEEMSFEEALEFLNGKAEEKWNILSLPECKEELEGEYKLVKELVREEKE